MAALQAVCARDTQALDLLRAGARAASETLRNLAPAQRAAAAAQLAAQRQPQWRALQRTISAEAAQLESRASVYQATPPGRPGGGGGSGDGGGGSGGGSSSSSRGGGGAGGGAAAGRGGEAGHSAAAQLGTAAAFNRAGAAQRVQEDVEELVLFEVAPTSMEDVLRSLQVLAEASRRWSTCPPSGVLRLDSLF